MLLECKQVIFVVAQGVELIGFLVWNILDQLQYAVHLLHTIVV